MGFPLPNHAVVLAEASNGQLGDGALLSHLRRIAHYRAQRQRAHVSLALASLDHTYRAHVPIFPQRSPPVAFDDSSLR